MPTNQVTSNECNEIFDLQELMQHQIKLPLNLLNYINQHTCLILVNSIYNLTELITSISR